MKTRKNIIIFIFSVLCANFVTAQQATSTTTYAKGVFTTTVSCTFESNQQQVDQTINNFVSQYKGNLNALFPWALKGLKLQGEKDDFIEFNVKTHTLEKQIVVGKMDIAVKLLGKKFTDVGYKVKIEKTKSSDDVAVISYYLYDCEEVIQSAKATFTVTKLNSTTCECKLVASTTLVKFYNMVMTKKMFRENLEWRFQKFTENMAKNAANAK
ncbi:MAG: hypothetical protein LBB41_04540 [Prevotellaceae bacterium]|jgi:hypothetical protein|nr:hypothetical protein [Prevotellaceae bacterium]